MIVPSPSTLAASIAAAQQWWRDAGVEFPCGDDLAVWAAPAGAADSAAVAAAIDQVEQVPDAPPLPSLGGEAALWPADLQAFLSWWLEEPSLECGGLRPRIAPRGDEGAGLMVLVPMPEAEDEKQLLSGAQGRMIDAIATALGFTGEQLYLASALPRHLALPDWDALAQAGLGAIVRHHVSLARPRRILAMGSNILPLLEHGPTQDSPPDGQSTIQGLGAPVLGTMAPETLLRAPRSRAALWRQLLDWT